MRFYYRETSQLAAKVLINVYLTGFVANYESVEVPDIIHINKEGHLPVIDLDINDESSHIGFLLCHKQDIGEPEDYQRLPFTVVIKENVSCYIYRV